MIPPRLTLPSPFSLSSLSLKTLLFLTISLLFPLSAFAAWHCQWEDPVSGNPLETTFDQDAIVVSSPQSVITVSVVNEVLSSVMLPSEVTLLEASASSSLLLQIPSKPGPYFASLASNETTFRLCIYVPWKATAPAGKWGAYSVAGHPLGIYRDPNQCGEEKVKLHPEAYLPPPWFILIEPSIERLPLWGSLTVGDLVVPDSKTGERHTLVAPISYPLLQTIEILREEIQRHGLPPHALRILSLFRAPFYNRRIGSTSFSRHLYGDAVDLVLDANGDQAWDDLNRDGRIDRTDGLWLVAMIEDLQAKGRIWPGGIGLYTFTTSEYRVTLHLDLRGHRATWAFHHDLRGRKHPFGWKSLHFAEIDEAERLAKEAKEGRSCRIPLYDLPSIEPFLTQQKERKGEAW